MPFLEKLFHSSSDNKKKPEEAPKVFRTSTGLKIEKGGVLYNATQEEIKKAQEKGQIKNLIPETDKKQESLKTPHPGDIFEVQGKIRTVNEAGVVVQPTPEQKEAWEKKQKEQGE